MNPPADLKWHPLESFSARFRANLAALETRDPGLAGRLREWKPGTPFFVAAAADQVYLGRPSGAGIEAVVDPVPAPAARGIVSKVFPASAVTGPMIVSGLGYGWLWDRLAKLPCRVDAVPGHRPPFYFLAGDVDQLWAVLHLLDWREFLADPRFAIFAGPDAVEQLQTFLIENPMQPEPRASMRIDASLPTFELDAFQKPVREARAAQSEEIAARLAALYAGRPDANWIARFSGGGLRVLGITSRYTTFLQYSMRDWLAGFERLGHEVRLFIEPQDHLLRAGLNYTKAVLEFRPDLIVIIDHYRAELGKIPSSIPCVMWVQDWLPNIYSDAAGAAQGPRDFCIGFSRLALTQSHGYPAERFMACPIGINEERFKPITLSKEDCARYGCDVSYVSHASAPADVLLKNVLASNADPKLGRLLWDLHDRLVGDFEAGGVTHAEWQLKRKLDESIAQTGIEPAPNSVPAILRLFNTQINNAIFRHQALRWVADLGVDLKLYGNGWETHPTLKRFACGPADNVRDLPKICAASKVNLQVTPHGSVHQRLLEGLIAGGFYLIRWTPGDQLGTACRALRDWCLAHGINSEAALRSIQVPHVREWIAECDELRVDHTDPAAFRLYDRLMEGGDAELMGRAGAVWPEQYPQVSFRSRAELQVRLARFLGNADEREQVAAAMREAIVENYTYTKISERLVRFIAADLRANGASPSAIAA